jgi:hypothetical protein
MSRRRYTPEDWPPTIELFLGFDPALETYFAQVFDSEKGEENAGYVVLWLTPSPREIVDADQLAWNVNRGIMGRLPALKLTPDMRKRLNADRKREDKGRWLSKPKLVRRREPESICALDFKAEP